MKMNKKSILFVMLLIFTLVFTLYSCAIEDKKVNNPDKNSNDASNTDETPQKEETTGPKSPVPSDIKFNGAKIRVLHGGHSVDNINSFRAEAINGEIVNDALYNRNMKIEHDLDVIFDIKELITAEEFEDTITNSVLADIDEYDLTVAVQWTTVPLVTKHVFTNIIDLPYVDLEQIWWPINYIKEMQIGRDSLFFLTGDMHLSYIGSIDCIYVNKRVYEDNFGDPDDIYKIVLDGKWTLDKISEMTKVMYKDLNGDGKSDLGDQFALVLNTSGNVEHFMYSSGLRTTARDDDWLPHFIVNNEKTVDFTNTLYSLYYENPGSRVMTYEEVYSGILGEKFMNDEVLFCLGGLGSSASFRDMKADYALIPFPKYNENEPSYLSLAHDGVFVYSVPLTVPYEKMDAVGAVLEAMAFESYQTVVPAYFEIALKQKYTRDATDDAFEIIDMIHANCTTDFAYIYNYALNNMGLLMRTMMTNKSKNFVSRYEKTEPKSQASLDALIDIYFQ